MSESEFLLTGWAMKRGRYYLASYADTIINFSTIYAYTSLGTLRHSREFGLGYNCEKDEWFGDIIDADGWRSLEPEEIEEIIEGFGIKEALSKRNVDNICNKVNDRKGSVRVTLRCHPTDDRFRISMAAPIWFKDLEVGSDMIVYGKAMRASEWTRFEIDLHDAYVDDIEDVVFGSSKNISENDIWDAFDDAYGDQIRACLSDADFQRSSNNILSAFYGTHQTSDEIVNELMSILRASPEREETIQPKQQTSLKARTDESLQATKAINTDDPSPASQHRER